MHQLGLRGLPLTGLQPYMPREHREKVKDDPFLLDMPPLPVTTVPVEPPELPPEVVVAPERAERRARRRLELPSGLDLEPRDLGQPMALSPKEVRSPKEPSELRQRLQQVLSEWLRELCQLPEPADVELSELRGSAAWLLHVLRDAEDFVAPPWRVTADELVEKGSGGRVQVASGSS